MTYDEQRMMELRAENAAKEKAVNVRNGWITGLSTALVIIAILVIPIVGSTQHNSGEQRVLRTMNIEKIHTDFVYINEQGNKLCAKINDSSETKCWNLR